MDANQLREVLTRCHLSQRSAARALEIDDRTMRYYASGDKPIPRHIEYALLWLMFVTTSPRAGLSKPK